MYIRMSGMNDLICLSWKVQNIFRMVSMAGFGYGLLGMSGLELVHGIVCFLGILGLVGLAELV
jgi:hypothetical protein